MLWCSQRGVVVRLLSSSLVVLRFKSSTTMAVPLSKSKFVTPPTIASFEHMQGWSTQLLEGIPKLDPELAALVEQYKDDLHISKLPLKLQTHATMYSLKQTKQQDELQRKVDDLPYSRMAGSPEEANFLCMLLEMMDAKVVVEVGVFRGLSTLAFALCLEGLKQKNPSPEKRKVVGLDISKEFAEPGMAAWKEAGVEDLIDFRVGDAKDSLSDLLKEDTYGEESADLCFIDADKISYDDYYEKCVKLTKKGGLIVVDNTLWGGRVAISDKLLEGLASKKGSDNELLDKAAGLALDTLAIKKLTEKIHNDDRIERVSFLTIADGVTICRKK